MTTITKTQEVAMMNDRFKFRQPMKCGHCGNIEFTIFTCHDGYRSGALMLQHNSFSTCYSHPDYHVHKTSEQCIGLKDIKDKLVFEGDRVKLQVDAKGTIYHGTIIWKYGQFHIAIDEDKSYHYCSDDYFSLADVEIIGSIHDKHLNDAEV